MLAATLAQQFEWLWFVWLLAFVVLELLALYLGTKRTDDSNWQGGTLSEAFYRSFHRNRLTKIVLVLFIAVLAFHFLFPL